MDTRRRGAGLALAVATGLLGVGAVLASLGAIKYLVTAWWDIRPALGILRLCLAERVALTDCLPWAWQVFWRNAPWTLGWVLLVASPLVLLVASWLLAPTSFRASPPR